MFPFWEIAVAPVLEAAGVRRLVEIGALRGENTELMLDRLGPDVELHVIDPVPDFDPAEHERRFAGQYVFHRDLSLNVLGGLPPMDAALVDGDHNWYTVYNELRLLREVAQGAGAPLPVLILHDVGWPYGRRDLYYAPETIPEEFRQPYRRAGMRPAHKRLMPYGAGLNPTMCNAAGRGWSPQRRDDRARRLHGGARPAVAVRRAADLLRVGHRRGGGAARRASPPWRPSSTASRAPKGRTSCSSWPKTSASSAMVFQHNVFFQHDRAVERLAARYLDSVKRGLIDEYYLENEVRLAVLAEHFERGTAPDIDRLRDPVRRDAEAFRRLRELRRDRHPPDRRHAPGGGLRVLPAAAGVGLDQLTDCLDTIRDEHVRGDFVDCGVGRGGAGDPAARLPRRTRTARSPACGSPIASAAPPTTGSPPTAADGLATCDPTSTRCATASTRFDAARRADRLPPGRPRRDARRTRRSSNSRCCTSARASGPRLASCSNSCTRSSPPGGVRRRSTIRPKPDVRDAVDAFRAAHGIDALEQACRCGRDQLAQGRADSASRASSRRRPRTGAEPRAARATASAGIVRPVGRHRRLQHATRGGPLAARVVAAVPAGRRGPRLRGDRRRERLGARRAARRRRSYAASGPSSATSISATTRRPRPRTPSTAGIARVARHARWP